MAKKSAKKPAASHKAKTNGHANGKGAPKASAAASSKAPSRTALAAAPKPPVTKAPAAKPAVVKAILVKKAPKGAAAKPTAKLPGAAKLAKPTRTTRRRPTTRKLAASAGSKTGAPSAAIVVAPRLAPSPAASPAIIVRDQRRRAVLVAGVRTPFLKAFTEYTRLDTIALGVMATRALLARTGLNTKEIDAAVWGGVILPSAAPNVAREIVLDLNLPTSVEAMTVTRACASGLQAITLAAAQIERGEADVVIAGGSDSTSNAELKVPQRVVHTLGPLALKKASPMEFLGAVGSLAPFTDVLPKMPRIAERTTGQVMGESAEEMAARNGITREEQDAFAALSHHRAAEAIRTGRFDREVAPVEASGGKWVHTDGLVRADTSTEKLSRLRPAFKRDGTVTAGNASPLTDGAAAVLLMEESKALSLGLRPLARFRSWAYTAVDPRDQLLMGPALAIPKALDRAGLTLAHADYVDLHEAFAAQVLSVLKMLGSRAFAAERLGRDAAVGEVPEERLNVHGGSIALGHPFGATGARMVTTMASELALTGKQFAVLGICAAGGLGAAAVLENAASEPRSQRAERRA
jgi:acetyl-CoA acyltransferase